MKETFDTVARRAFEIFEANGRVVGRDWANWLQAEAELLHPAHLDVTETDDDFTVRAEVPGFKEKDIEIDLEPRRLTIKGARESREEHRKGKTVYGEHCADRIFRVVDLPGEVDSASSAAYRWWRSPRRRARGGGARLRPRRDHDGSRRRLPAGRRRGDRAVPPRERARRSKSRFPLGAEESS